MKTFKIEITETLQKIVEVSAKNKEKAFEIVKERYKNEEIVLTENDYVNTEISEYTE